MKPLAWIAVIVLAVAGVVVRFAVEGVEGWWIGALLVAPLILMALVNQDRYSASDGPHAPPADGGGA